MVRRMRDTGHEIADGEGMALGEEAVELAAVAAGLAVRPSRWSVWTWFSRIRFIMEPRSLTRTAIASALRMSVRPAAWSKFRTKSMIAARSAEGPRTKYEAAFGAWLKRRNPWAAGCRFVWNDPPQQRRGELACAFHISVKGCLMEFLPEPRPCRSTGPPGRVGPQSRRRPGDGADVPRPSDGSRA